MFHVRSRRPCEHLVTRELTIRTVPSLLTQALITPDAATAATSTGASDEVSARATPPTTRELPATTTPVAVATMILRLFTVFLPGRGTSGPCDDVPHSGCEPGHRGGFPRGAQMGPAISA
jgi:hypothetical protein